MKLIHFFVTTSYTKKTIITKVQLALYLVHGVVSFLKFGETMCTTFTCEGHPLLYSTVGIQAQTLYAQNGA